MNRPILPLLVVTVGVLLLVDLVVVNPTISDIAAVAVEAVILVGAGAAIAVTASLAWRRAVDLWSRRGDPIGAALVLVGIGAMLVAGLRPGATGASDPWVAWLVGALLVPIAATLFGLLFVTTVVAARRSVASRRRDAFVLMSAALVMLVLLLPIGGQTGGALATAAGWVLAGPVAAVFRGILLGVAILAAVAAARTLLGVGAGDE
ncbi:MAG TPA: hypothetical protein VF367_02180 [Candidatus Limnocylindria bacterium]